jgi:hypothetical protein
MVKIHKSMVHNTWPLPASSSFGKKREPPLHSALWSICLNHCWAALYFYEEEPPVLVLKNKLNWVLVPVPQRNGIKNPNLGLVL